MKQKRPAYVGIWGNFMDIQRKKSLALRGSFITNSIVAIQLLNLSVTKACQIRQLGT